MLSGRSTDELRPRLHLIRKKSYMTSSISEPENEISAE